MKVCFVGLGSIGKRHLHNLCSVCKEELQIDAVRSGISETESEISDMLHAQYSHVEEIPDDYDVIFITNPTILHYETIIKSIKKAKNLFIEKPIFEKCSGQLENIDFSNNINYIACPLRHKSIMKYVKKSICNKEKIVSVRVISSSYLPDWRKGNDYRTCYSAHRNMGGGVSIDLVHEWDYLTDLFGYPINVQMKRAHISDLEIDSDDVAVYIAEYNDKIVEVHLDYIGHRNERKLEIYCNDKTYYIDLINNTIEKYQRGRLVEEKSFSMEDSYKNEMKYFLECIEGNKRNINPPEKAYRVLALATGERL